MLNTLSKNEHETIRLALLDGEVRWEEKKEALRKLVAFNPERGVCQLKDTSKELSDLYSSLTDRIACAQKLRKDLGRIR